MNHTIKDDAGNYNAGNCWLWYIPDDLTVEMAAAELEWYMQECQQEYEYEINNDASIAVYNVPEQFMEDLCNECGGSYD